MNSNPKKKETPNWLQLPRDITLHIFLKIGIIDILFNVQFVCLSWLEIAKHPILYRCVYMHEPQKHFGQHAREPFVKMAMKAIDRSCGQLVDFSIRYAGTDEMLRQIVGMSCELKRLRLVNCHQVSDNVLVEFVEKMPKLEELELTVGSFTAETITAVGLCCPELKSFSLNDVGSWISDTGEVLSEFDDEAMAIAGSMSGLRSLQLFGNSMYNSGLQAILDECGHLEFLDLRQCDNLELEPEGNLWKKCQGIGRLRLPDDFSEDIFDGGWDESEYFLESEELPIFISKYYLDFES